MMIPQYRRFYGGSIQDILSEYATTFFSMVNAMYRIQADEALMNITTVSAGMSGKNGDLVHQLQKQSKGAHGILQEVKNIKRINRG